MGKRSSNYPRAERDLYPTSFKAVVPLISYLQRDGIVTFAEPCCGDCDLVSHLESFGLCCNYHGDIRFGQDALWLRTETCRGAQAIISNLPFKYPDAKGTYPYLLLDLMRHFLALPALPIWLLMPHDFLTNAYAPPFLKHCSDIVVVGRVQWIPGSAHKGGFENSDWMRFDARHYGVTAFHNDRNAHRQHIISSAPEAFTGRSGRGPTITATGGPLP